MNPWTKTLLIALRIAIGWHFLYEGVFKIDSETGSVVYDTSWHTLYTSLARLRDYYEHPPAEGLRLDEATARADAWYDEVVKAFKARKSLGDDQKARLAELRDKVKLAAADAVRGRTANEDIVNFDWDYVRTEVLKLAAAPASDHFTSLGYLQASAGPMRPLFRALVPDMDGLERLTTAAALASLDDRHSEILRFFNSQGKPFDAAQRKRLEEARDSMKANLKATLEAPGFRARLEDYRQMRQRVQGEQGILSAPFTRERLDADRKKLDVMAADLLAYVNEPLAELAIQTQNIATVEQMGLGPLPRTRDASQWVDLAIKLSLTAIGLCLMLGLFTPVAAFAAAAQLAVFYLASPPWPGLPAASAGGHYLYVDRNFIEGIAALLVAVTASGRWAGLDFYLVRLLERRSAQPQPAVLAATR